ncbi:phage tail protein [Phaeospirillum tilakii]|uniref:Phage tail protein n=1 Tax=Phaeospirillum tilakii TaxID=741673 RepID=A0ABW5C7D7_9PROT
MSDPFIGEIRLFANIFVPDGWLLCAGQTLTIAQYQSLFMVIGNIYGGDGINNFKLPNFTGRTGIGVGQASNGRGMTSYPLGATPGEASLALDITMLPSHTHGLEKLNPVRGNDQKTAAPLNSSNLDALTAASNNAPRYANLSPPADLVPLADNVIGPFGAAQGVVAHENRQPNLALFHGIAYAGIYPARP